MRTLYATYEKITSESNTARNVEATVNSEGTISIRVTREDEGREVISLAKELTPIEAIKLGVALLREVTI